MRRLLAWVLPGLLTDKLELLSVVQTHALARRLHIFDGLHDFLHGLCPCEIDLDPGEDDLEQAIAA